MTETSPVTGGTGPTRSLTILAALVLIAAANSLVAIMIERAISEQYLHNSADAAQEFFSTVLNSTDAPDSLFAGPSPGPALLSFSRHLQKLPDLVRANIYSPDGFIRFSTEKNLIGVKFPDNEDLNVAFSGRAVSRLTAVSDDTKSEHLALNRTPSPRLIEAYVPVSDATGRVVCVIEFYRLPRHMQASMADARMIIWLALTVGGLILFVGFWLLLSRNRPPVLPR